MTDPLPTYPLMLRLTGRRCVVVGGGAVAGRKAADLLSRGAEVTVVAPRLHHELDALRDAPGVVVHARRYERGDLAGAFLAFAATDDREINAAVADEARARGVLVNVVDDPAACDFVLPATLERGLLTIAVSTAGASPALAAHLRDEIAERYGPEYEAFLPLLMRLRERVLDRIADPGERAALFRRVLDSDALELLRGNQPQSAWACMEALVDQAEKDAASS